MKWHTMRYFTRVCTVWNDENNFRGEKYIFYRNFDQQPLKYKQDSSTLSVSLEYKDFIKDTVVFTKALHYDHSYYHTAFSAATSYPPTEHMG